MPELEPSSTRSYVISLLREHGIAPTHQRVLIAQILFARKQHMSADQVLDQINVDNQVVSKATVYNTLGLFAKKGLIKEVIIDPTKVFYDSNLNDHHHIYFTDSGQLLDIEEKDVSISKIPALPEGVVVEGVDVVIRVRHTS